MRVSINIREKEASPRRGGQDNTPSEGGEGVCGYWRVFLRVYHLVAPKVFLIFVA